MVVSTVEVRSHSVSTVEPLPAPVPSAAEDPDSAATLAARVESYRLKGMTLAALSEVQLVAGDATVASTANEAFELTRPVHYARDGADLYSKTDKAKSAVDRFIALAAAEIQSVPIHNRNRQVSQAEPSMLDVQAS